MGSIGTGEGHIGWESGKGGHENLVDDDLKINGIIEQEKDRQTRGLELIASEVGKGAPLLGL